MRAFQHTIILVILLLSTSLVFADETKVKLSVYKEQNCGCCGKWVTYLERLDVQIDTHNLDAAGLIAVKDEYKIDPQYRSCHTAIYQDKYIFEGHIPAKFITQFLSEKPKGAIGLTVPGMPVGTPGMEYENMFMPYDILLVKDDGSYEVYAHIGNYDEQF